MSSISPIRTFPEDADNPDERLRIFWIEDNPEQTPYKTLGDAVDQTCLIAVVLSSTQAESLLKDPSQTSLCRDGFDGYLTDFRLRDVVKTRMAIPGDEASPPSEGLLVGLLVALNFAQRPAIVVPYSGYPDEFGAVWNLVQKLMPNSIKMTRKLDKKDLSLREIVGEVSKRFREMLIVWNHEERISLREDEVQEFLSLPDKTTIKNDKLLVMTHNGKARAIRIGALFLDSKVVSASGIPSEIVKVFLRQMQKRPGLLDEDKRARKIANEYIAKAQEDESRNLYRQAFSQLDGGNKPTLQSVKRSYPSLSLKATEASKADRRNALLIILVYLYGRFVMPYQLLEEFDATDRSAWQMPFDEVVRKVSKVHKLHLFPVVRDGFELLRSEFAIGPKQTLEAAFEQIADQVPDLPNGLLYFQRLIIWYTMPYPEKPDDIPASIKPVHSFGKNLIRLLNWDLSEEQQRATRFRQIMSGESCFIEKDLRVVLAYAAETIPRTFGWPGWLRPQGVYDSDRDR